MATHEWTSVQADAATGILTAHDAVDRPITLNVSAASRLQLTDDERNGITLAVQSAFLKLKHPIEGIVPIFEDFGFRPPSAGVVAGDLSETIEKAIVQYCASFRKGEDHSDLQRLGDEWEVKLCKDGGLTISHSETIAGENYIVVNYKADTVVKRIWVLWGAKDEWFSPKAAHSNARALRVEGAAAHIETIFSV